MCVGATSAHAVGSHVDVALLDASGQPSRVVTLTVPGTARCQVEVGTYAVTVDGQRVATVTASLTAQESSGIGIGCPGPTTDAG
jgi:hypothetical protein